MDKTPGSDPRSGLPLKKKKRRKRKRKKPKSERQPQAQVDGNGKTDWKEVAKASQEQVTSLEQSLASQRKKYQELVTRFKLLEKTGLDERAAVKLRIFQSLWGRLINFQAKCPEDKKKVDTLVDEYMPALKKAVEAASKPL
jgi:molecular chaperone GrpE (heat shock protein)